MPERAIVKRAVHEQRDLDLTGQRGRTDFVYDRLGLWFTLVCIGMPPSGPLVEAAARRAPLDVLRLDEPDLIAVYGRRLMLVRPDQHIA